MSRNDVTGDALVSAAANDKFRDGWDAIWNKKKVCRPDGRCQYAIDCGAEGEGHCPEGKCLMPDHKEPPFRCVFCGMPSWVDPLDQTPPPDYCHESDHGEPE